MQLITRITDEQRTALQMAEQLFWREPAEHSALPGEVQHAWLWLAAQMLAESAGVANARSSAGAMGLMQLMPDTWREQRAELHIACSDPFNAVPNIFAGVHYLRRMWLGWRAGARSAPDRLRFALASYNAGFGNVLRAQQTALVSGCDASELLRWSCIAEYLPSITGSANAQQTRDYVARIEQYYEQLADELAEEASNGD